MDSIWPSLAFICFLSKIKPIPIFFSNVESKPLINKESVKDRYVINDVL